MEERHKVDYNQRGFNEGSCGDPLEDHIQDILVGVEVGSQLTGLRFGCVDSYRALLEVAEFIRRENDFEPYRATGQGVEQAWEKVAQAFQNPVQEPVGGFLPE